MSDPKTAAAAAAAGKKRGRSDGRNLTGYGSNPNAQPSKAAAEADGDGSGPVPSRKPTQQPAPAGTPAAKLGKRYTDTMSSRRLPEPEKAPRPAISSDSASHAAPDGWQAVDQLRVDTYTQPANSDAGRFVASSVQRLADQLRADTDTRSPQPMEEVQPPAANPVSDADDVAPPVQELADKDSSAVTGSPTPKEVLAPDADAVLEEEPAGPAAMPEVRNKFVHTVYEFKKDKNEKDGLALADTVHDAWLGLRGADRVDRKAVEIRTAVAKAFNQIGICPTIDTAVCLSERMDARVFVSDIEDSTITYFETNSNYISPMAANAQLTYAEIRDYDDSVKLGKEKRTAFDSIKLHNPRNDPDDDIIANKAKITTFMLQFLLDTAEADIYMTFDAGADFIGKLFSEHENVSGLMLPQNIGDSASTSTRRLGKYENLYYFPVTDPEEKKFKGNNNALSRSYLRTFYKNEGFSSEFPLKFSYGVEVGDNLERSVEISYDTGFSQGPSLNYLLELLLQIQKGGNLSSIHPDKAQILRIGDMVQNDEELKRLIKRFAGAFFLDVKRGGDQDQCEAALETLRGKFIEAGKFLIFVTIDRLCALYARLLGLPTIWHNDTEIRLYKNKVTDRGLNPADQAVFAAEQAAKKEAAFGAMYDFYRNAEENREKLVAFMATVCTAIKEERGLRPLQINRLVDIWHHLNAFNERWAELPAVTGDRVTDITKLQQHFATSAPRPQQDAAAVGARDLAPKVAEAGRLTEIKGIIDGQANNLANLKSLKDALEIANLAVLAKHEAFKTFESQTVAQRGFRKVGDEYRVAKKALEDAIKAEEAARDAADAAVAAKRNEIINEIIIATIPETKRNLPEWYIDLMIAAVQDYGGGAAAAVAPDNNVSFGTQFLLDMHMTLLIPEVKFEINSDYSFLNYSDKEAAKMEAAFNTASTNFRDGKRFRSPLPIAAQAESYNAQLDSYLSTFFDKVQAATARNSLCLYPNVALEQMPLIRVAQAAYLGYVKWLQMDEAKTATNRDLTKYIIDLATEGSVWLQKVYGSTLPAVFPVSATPVQCQAGGAYSDAAGNAIREMAARASRFINSELGRLYPDLVKRFALDQLITHLDMATSEKNRTYLLYAYEYALGVFSDETALSTFVTQRDAVKAATDATINDIKATHKTELEALILKRFALDQLITHLDMATSEKNRTYLLYAYEYALGAFSDKPALLGKFVKQRNAVEAATDATINDIKATHKTELEALIPEVAVSNDATNMAKLITDMNGPVADSLVDELVTYWKQNKGVVDDDSTSAITTLIDPFTEDGGGLKLGYPLFLLGDGAVKGAFLAYLEADKATNFPSRLSAYALIALTFIDDLLKGRVASRTSLLLSRVAAGADALPAALSGFTLEASWGRIPALIRDILIQIQAGRISREAITLAAAGGARHHRRTPRRRRASKRHTLRT